MREEVGEEKQGQLSEFENSYLFTKPFDIMSNAAGRGLHQTSVSVENVASKALFRMSKGVSRKSLHTVDRFCCDERHSASGEFNSQVYSRSRNSPVCSSDVKRLSDVEQSSIS